MLRRAWRLSARRVSTGKAVSLWLGAAMLGRAALGPTYLLLSTCYLLAAEAPLPSWERGWGEGAALVSVPAMLRLPFPFSLRDAGGFGAGACDLCNRLACIDVGPRCAWPNLHGKPLALGLILSARPASMCAVRRPCSTSSCASACRRSESQLPHPQPPITCPRTTLSS